jgi:hypothetical protein
MRTKRFSMRRQERCLLCVVADSHESDLESSADEQRHAEHAEQLSLRRSFIASHEQGSDDGRHQSTHADPEGECNTGIASHLRAEQRRGDDRTAERGIQIGTHTRNVTHVVTDIVG